MNTDSHDELAGSDNAAAAEGRLHHDGSGDGEGRQPIIAKVGKVILPVDSDAWPPGSTKSIANVLTAAAADLPAGRTLLTTIAEWLPKSPVFIEVHEQVIQVHGPSDLIDELVAKGVLIEADWPHETEIEEWLPLGSVTIDTVHLMLVDPVHADIDLAGISDGQFSLDTNVTGVITETGMGDGRYLVEGRYADCPFGRRLAEIRVCFLDDEGNWLGGDVIDGASESSDT